MSVVTPTCARRHRFHEALYRCFAWQRHPAKELVVVDDPGPPSPFFAALKDARVRYVQADAPGESVGAKRNRALALARGDAVAHFDDDDLYLPGYLGDMLRRLDEGPADVVKLSAWFWYDLSSDVLARYDGVADGDHSRLYGYGFSYLYRRERALAVGFPDRSFGEDYEFCLRSMSAGGSVMHFKDSAKSPTVLHIVHGRNTSNCFVTQQVPVSELPRLFDTKCSMHLDEVRRAVFDSAVDAG